jgi:hypothetical protein
MLSSTYFPAENPLKNSFHEELDVTIVFGQGPIKPLLFEEELTSEQQSAWNLYKTDPLHRSEPDFFVIEQEMPSDIFDASHIAYWEKIRKVRLNRELSDDDKVTHLKWILLTWQRWGRFSLKNMAKQNAIAAGIALLTGMTKEVILSGGRTLPEWKREEFLHLFRMQNPDVTEDDSPEFRKQFDLFLKYSIRWPSEAEVMADMIRHNFSEAYQERTGRAISEVIYLETESTNTLENVTFILNTYPHLLGPDKKIGFLGADFHLERVALIAHRFQMLESPGAQLSAQKLLAGTASLKQKQELKDIFCYYMSEINPWMADRIDTEKRWITGLTMPEYLTYWLGYTFLVDDPKIVADVLRHYHNGTWQQVMRDAFAKVGLDFDRFTALDLEKIARSDPEGYRGLRERLTELTRSQHRVFPS